MLIGCSEGGWKGPGKAVKNRTWEKQEGNEEVQGEGRGTKGRGEERRRITTGEEGMKGRGGEERRMEVGERRGEERRSRG